MNSDEKMAKLLQSLPPGAIGLVWGESLFGKLIRLYEGWKYGIRDLPNHAFIYIGSGNNSIIEAESTVELNSLTRYLNSRHKVKILIYKPLTVTQLQFIKTYAYASRGKKYDIKGILSFLFKNVKEEETANYCSELVAECYNAASVSLSSQPWGDNPNACPSISPADVLIWAQNHKDQWDIIDVWPNNN